MARELGYSAKMIRGRLEKEEWTALHPGVFTFAGSAPTWHRDAVAACDWSRGVLAGRAAGFLHGLPGCQEPPLEVLTTDRKVMPRCGIVVHLTNRLPREQVSFVKGIPCTSVERTLLDLCGFFGDRAGAIALDDALRRGLVTLGSLDHCLFLTARRGRRGCGRLRRLVQERVGLHELPNTPLETLVFEFLRRFELPLPEIQYEIRDGSGRFVARPDFVYSKEKLILEAHSKQWHWGLRAEREDLIRHERIVQLGFRVIYLTAADVTLLSEQSALNIDRALKDVNFTPESCPGWGPMLEKLG